MIRLGRWVNKYIGLRKDFAGLAQHLKEESKVTVTVLDFSGRMMKEVTNETLASGPHNVILNSDKLTTGDYFVQIQIGDKTFSQKITVD